MEQHPDSGRDKILALMKVKCDNGGHPPLQSPSTYPVDAFKPARLNEVLGERHGGCSVEQNGTVCSAWPYSLTLRTNKASYIISKDPNGSFCLNNYCAFKCIHCVLCFDGLLESSYLG